MANTTGEMGDPCGRPVATSIGFLSQPSTLMMTRRSRMKLSVQLTEHSSLPIARILRSRQPGVTTGEGGGHVHEQGSGDAHPALRLLSLGNGDPDRIDR